MSTKNRAPRPTQTTNYRTRTSGRIRTKSKPGEEDIRPRMEDMRPEGSQLHIPTPLPQQPQPVISIVAVEQLLRAYGCAANVCSDEHGQVIATAANPRMQPEVDRRLQEVLRMKVENPQKGRR
ncbi:hypothetical protein GGQ85_004360 [Nitrobacter vulgaris]|nr:hypothetical protein [Nitrobacter vulgaris]